MNDHLLWFRRGGTNYAFRGYDVNPGGRCLAFKAGGVVRYIPLTTGTGGLLCERAAGGNYTLARLYFVIYIYCYVSIEFSPNVGYRVTFYNFTLQAATGGFSESTSVGINIYGQAWNYHGYLACGFSPYQTYSGMGQSLFVAFSDGNSIPYYYACTFYAFGGSWSGTGVFNNNGNHDSNYYAVTTISGSV